jgi:hypothetical protein
MIFKGICLTIMRKSAIPRVLSFLLYGFPHSTAAVYVLNNLRDYNKKGQLKKELSELTFQKYAIDRFFSSRSQVIMALMNLLNNGITEEQIISLNNFLKSKKLKQQES